MSRGAIRWRIGLRASPETAFDLLSTDRGRERFWAEQSLATGSSFELHFAMGVETFVEVLECEPPQRFTVRYFGTDTRFEIDRREDGGCDLTVTAEGVPDDDWDDVHAGWVSVLLILKAAADHGIDLRLHDPNRSWRQGFVDQ